MTLAYQDIVEQLGISSSTNTHSLSRLKKLKLKIETISPLMKLFFAIIRKRDRIVSAPKINLAFEGLYQKSLSLTPFIS